MRCRSNNYYDVLIWITKVINSCETVTQLNSASKLIRCFRYSRVYSSKADKLKNMGDVWKLENLVEAKLKQMTNKNSKT